MVPIDDARIFLTSGGGDSVEAAAKLARRFWDVVGRPEKRLIVTRELCYHGLHGFGTGIAGLDVNRTGQGELLADTERVATNEAEALDRVVAEHGADAVAAFFCEPIIGAGGVVHPADGYLDQVQRICRENEILFVVDEVITGFGRTGRDVRERALRARPGRDHDGEGGHLRLSAARCGGDRRARLGAVLGARERGRCSTTRSPTRGTRAPAPRRSPTSRSSSARIWPGGWRRSSGRWPKRWRRCESHPLVREVRAGVGLLAGIELHDPAKAEETARRCLDAGVILRAITDGTLQVSPPFVIDESDIGLLAGVIAAELDRVAA